jgi:hypothetical protein
MLKQLFSCVTCAISLLGFSILPSFALNSSTLKELLDNKYILVQFQVELKLSEKCRGQRGANDELVSRDTANNCLWDDSSLGKKTAKPDIYVILVDESKRQNQPLPQRNDCKDTPYAHCILECPENQYRCQFTLLLNSEHDYSLFLFDKDLLVDDNAGVFVFSPHYPSSNLWQLKSKFLTVEDIHGKSVVSLSETGYDPFDACLSSIETLANDPKSGSSLPFMLNQQTRCQDNILLTQKFRKFLKP